MKDKHQNASKNAQNRSLGKRIRRHVIGRQRDYFVVTQPGFENICRKELIDLGLDPAAVQLTTGGVLFRSRFVDCTRANLYLRCAGRILMRVVEFKATHFRKLEKCLFDIPWEIFLYSRCRPNIHVTTRKSRLYHKDAIAGYVHKSIKACLSSRGLPAPEAYDQNIYIRGVDDLFQVSIDTSGDNLYKRGIKTRGAKAPVRETTAAWILKTAGYRMDRPLIDPMCGSGSFSIEAAMVVKNIPPGMFRTFSFMNWPAFGDAQWAFLKAQARKTIARAEKPMIFASDSDGTGCKKLKTLVKQHAMDDVIQVGCIDFFNLKPDVLTPDKGLVVLNPPYGLRLGEKNENRQLYQKIMVHLIKYYKGWQIAVMAPNRNYFGKIHAGLTVKTMFHGGLKVWLLKGKIP